MDLCMLIGISFFDYLDEKQFIQHIRLMILRESNQEKLIVFLQKELQQQLALEQYYQKQMAELKQGLQQTSVAISASKPSPIRNKTVRLKTQQVSIMEESAVSIVSTASKGQKKETKREASTFDMEYQMLSRQIIKLIDSLSNKGTVPKKSTTFTPKKNSSFTNKSTLKPAPVVPQFTMNFSTVSVSKSDHEQNQSTHADRQILLSQLGYSTLILSNDEVVSKLIGNLRNQELKFVEAVVYRGKMSARSKMRNYLQRLCQKNEETIFKLRQKTIDRSLSRIENNRQTVRNGYTRAMKQLIAARIKL